MSRSVKKWLIIAASLVILGCVVFASAMTVAGWDFASLSTVYYVKSEYQITEAYKNISINTNIADVKLVPSDKNAVECYEQNNIKYSVKVVEDTLAIQVIDTRRWYEYLDFGIDSSKITVFIPAGEYGKLWVKNDTGDVTVPSEFSFENIEISGNTGDVECYASASGDVKIRLDTGDIKVKNITAHSLVANVTTGEVKATDVTCKSFKSKGETGEIKLENVKADEVLEIERDTGDVVLNGCESARISIETDTGDVGLNGCDGDEIYIETDTGVVNGTLRSDKIFNVSTDTGNKNVPDSVDGGGKCVIKTDTGDITIRIEK